MFFNWRDTQNPEGGGSERYVETMARGLVERGARVTIFCAAHEHAPRDEVVDGVRYVRRGDHLGVYLAGDPPPATSTVRQGRPRRRRAERTALLHPARHPQAGRRPGPPRAPGAVAGRLPGPARPGRLVDRARRWRPALYRRASTSRSPARPAASSSPLGVDARTHRGRPQRHRAPPVARRAAERRAPAVRAGPARAAQAGRARHRRRRRAARRPPGRVPVVVGNGWWEDDLRTLRRRTPAPATPSTFTAT